jgi:hypothetical protein
MDLSRYPTAAIPARMPTWAITLLMLGVSLLFADELASINAISGWSYDDLFSLWASEPTKPFLVVFRERIITDSNPPLYFSLLHLLRQTIPDDGMAIVAVNAGAIAAAAAAVYMPSRPAGVSGLAMAGIAAFALSGPVLYFTPEGRSYVMALSIVFVASWYTALLIEGFPAFTVKKAAILGCLAAMTHVYAALFCGSIAAGLLIAGPSYKRKDLLKPGLALGLSASLVFGIWLSIAYDTLGNIDWIEFSARGVLNAALSVKEIALGSNASAIVLLAIFSYGLLNKTSRPLFFVFLIAFLLFALLPVITSFVQPIIRSRYWQIGAAALPVLLLFAAKSWIFENIEVPGDNRIAVGSAALCVLAASSVFGIANAKHYLHTKGFWRGADLVRPYVSHCREGSVHVYYEHPTKPYEPWPWELWDFHKLTGAPQAVFADAGAEATPWLDAADSSCPVLGWAEDSLDWQKIQDTDLVRFLKINTSLNEVQIVRHETGFVILKRSSEAPAS